MSDERRLREEVRVVGLSVVTALIMIGSGQDRDRAVNIAVDLMDRVEAKLKEAG